MDGLLPGELHVGTDCEHQWTLSLSPFTPRPPHPRRGEAVALECPGLAGCGLHAAHTLTTNPSSCCWDTCSAPTPSPLHYRSSCLGKRPSPPVTLSMGVVEAIDPASPSPCPSPVPGGYRLPHSSTSYSQLQGRGGGPDLELDLGAAAGGVLEGSGTAAERRTPLVDLFCETCSRPWLIGWWDQVGLEGLGGEGNWARQTGGHLG